MDTVSISVDVHGSGPPPLPADAARAIAAQIIARMSIYDLAMLLGDPACHPDVLEVVQQAVRDVLDGADIDDIDIDDSYLAVTVTHGL